MLRNILQDLAERFNSANEQIEKLRDVRRGATRISTSLLRDSEGRDFESGSSKPNLDGRMHQPTSE
jgi:hypothetical protein